MKSNKIKVPFEEYCNTYNLDYDSLIKDEDYRKNLIIENDRYFELVNEEKYKNDIEEQPLIRTQINEAKGEEGCLFLLNCMFLMLLNVASIVSFFYFSKEKDMRTLCVIAFAISLPVWFYFFIIETDGKVRKWQIKTTKYLKRYLISTLVINIILIGLLVSLQIPGLIHSLDLKTIGIIVIILLLVLIFSQRN